MSKAIKCESCGKFRKEVDCFTSGNEYGSWIECIYCCPKYDRDEFIKYNRPDLQKQKEQNK